MITMKKKMMALGLVLIMLAQVLTGCGNQAANPGASKGTSLKLAIVAKGYGDDFLK